MKRQFHSIESHKKATQLNFSQNARKSHWDDLEQLKVQKLQALLSLTEMVILYDRKDHDPILQDLLEKDNRFQALIGIATTDIKNIKSRIEKIAVHHNGKTGAVGLNDLPVMLKLSEQYLSLDNFLSQLEETVISELSEIFSSSIEKAKTTH